MTNRSKLYFEVFIETEIEIPFNQSRQFGVLCHVEVEMK